METQTCLYEVLGIDMSASIDEIRSAYRKLALKWHPDKIQQSGASPEACQEATIRFQEIGRAYEVLADPAERAWYDSHRSQILSSSSSSSSHSEGFEVNLWPYFSPTVFSGYGETGKGFYAVYNDVFRKLHQQEVAFAHAHSIRPPVDPPDMGGAATPYAQVSRFYNHWLGFGTVKDFSWCDEYRTSLAPSRKVRRLMEEENKKIRSKARKEFNEAVRRLAAFVKRRDKRVLERQVEVQRLEKEKEEKRKLKRQQEEAEKALKAKLYEEAEWTKAVDDAQLGDDESDIDDSLGSYDWDSKAGKSGTGNRKDRQEEFYCIICNKKFRSEEQWRNHERSKKHLDRVASLKESFREEDENIEARFSAMSTPQATDEPVVEKSLAGSPIDDSAEEEHKDVREENGKDMDSLMSSVDKQETISSDGESGDDESSLLNMVNWHQQNTKEARLGNRGSGTTEDEVRRENEKGDQVNEEVKEHDGYNEGEEKDKEDETIAEQNVEEEEEEGGNEEVKNNVCDVEEEEQEDNDETFMVMMKSYKNRQKWEDDDEQESYMHTRNHAAESNMVDNAKTRTKGKRRAEKKRASGSDRHSELAEVLALEKQVDRTMLNHEISGYNKDSHSHDVISQETASEGARLSKGGRPSSHATALKEQIKKPAKGKKNKGTAKMSTNTCEVCGEDFESRNLLFKHISITNHAVLKGK